MLFSGYKNVLDILEGQKQQFWGSTVGERLFLGYR